jgi:hypothetical protein
MLHPATLKPDFAQALNHAVRRVSVSALVIRSVPQPTRPVPRYLRLCFVGSTKTSKTLPAKDNCREYVLGVAATFFVFPVIRPITGKIGSFRPDHDSFVTRPSGCRHRANRIAKRLLRRGYFAAI